MARWSPGVPDPTTIRLVGSGGTNLGWPFLGSYFSALLPGCLLDFPQGPFDMYHLTMSMIIYVLPGLCQGFSEWSPTIVSGFGFDLAKSMISSNWVYRMRKNVPFGDSNTEPIRNRHPNSGAYSRRTTLTFSKTSSLDRNPIGTRLQTGASCP